MYLENMYLLAAQIIMIMVMESVCAVYGFVNDRLLRAEDERITTNVSASNNQRNMTSMDLLRILETVKDLKDQNLQFLHNEEYEDTLIPVMKHLSSEYIGLMLIRNDRLMSTLNQLLSTSNINTILVFIDSPKEVLFIFKLMKEKMLKSHMVKWLLIMEGDEAESSLVYLEELATEGTQIMVYTKDSGGILNFFYSEIDMRGVTRFRRFKSTKEQHLPIIGFGNQEKLQRYDLSGRLMTISVKDSPLTMEYGQTYPDGSVELKSGTNVVLVKLLSSALNFTFRAVPPTDGVWGNPQPNGTVTGVIGMVARREASFGVASLGITESREKVIDFTLPYFTSWLLLFSRSPKVKNRALAVLSTFSQQVWLIVIATILLMGPLIYLVAHLPMKEEKYLKYNLQFYLFNMFRSIVLQGNFVPTTSWSKKWILISWYFFCLLFYAIYSGMLTSVLALPSYETPIDSLYDLPRAVKDGYTIGITKGTSFVHNFKSATEGVIKQTWELFNHEDPSQSFIPGLWEAVRRILEEKFVYIGDFAYVGIVKRRFEEGKFHFGSEIYMPYGIAIGCQTGSPLTEIFSMIILRDSAMGLPHKTSADAYRKISKEPSVRDGQPTNFSVTLVHLQAAFYILVLGMAVATVVLLWERVYFAFSHEKL